MELSQEHNKSIQDIAVSSDGYLEIIEPNNDLSESVEPKEISEVDTGYLEPIDRRDPTISSDSANEPPRSDAPAQNYSYVTLL